MNYIDIFRHLVEKEVIKVNADKEFIDNLYNEIRAKAIDI
jgi:hypothetical protein